MGKPETITPSDGWKGELQQDTTVGRTDLTRWDTSAGRGTARLITTLGRSVGAYTALILTLVIGIGVAFLMAFLVARVYDATTEHDGIAALDHPALLAAIQVRTPQLDAFAAAIAYIFGTIGMPILACIAILVLSLRRKSWTPVILIVGAGLGSLLMTIAGKDIIGRHRPALSQAVPPFEYSPSFPSGHTLNATVIIGVIGYLLWLRRHSLTARTLCVLVPVLVSVTVGFTRILLGAHWFTDVIAAWLLGAAWLTLIITTHRLYLTARKHTAQKHNSQKHNAREQHVPPASGTPSLP